MDLQLKRTLVLILSRPVEEPNGYGWARIIVNEERNGQVYDSGIIGNVDELIALVYGIPKVDAAQKERAVEKIILHFSGERPSRKAE
jgi:hypothetical protein